MVDGSARAGLTVPAQDPGPGAMSELIQLWCHHPLLLIMGTLLHSVGAFTSFIFLPPWGKTRHNCNQTWHDVWADDNRPAIVIVINEPFWLMVIAIV